MSVTVTYPTRRRLCDAGHKLSVGGICWSCTATRRRSDSVRAKLAYMARQPAPGHADWKREDGAERNVAHFLDEPEAPRTPRSPSRWHGALERLCDLIVVLSGGRVVKEE